MNLFDDLPEVCRREVPLAPFTWFKLGGPAEYFIEPKTEEQLVTVIRRCHESGTALRFLGFGANVLVPDDGVRGVVIRLTTAPFTQISIEGSRLVCGAGADMTRLVLQAVRNGLKGVEQLAGIPGTVGGGVAMNCGGRYGEIGTTLALIRVVGADGEVYERDHDDLAFAYRRCELGTDCVVSATFKLEKTDPVELERRFREIWMYKQNTQPPLGAHSVGCIFRNPNGRSAGELIDKAGLKGVRVGSAFVSDRHANFVLSDPNGRAADVLSLIQTIEERVEQYCGIRLEPEVRIW